MDKTAYVTNYGTLGTGDTVTPIATATNAPGTPITVGSGGPYRHRHDPNGQTVYVGSWDNGTGTSVTPVATATNTAGTPITVGRVPHTASPSTRTGRRCTSRTRVPHP